MVSRACVGFFGLLSFLLVVGCTPRGTRDATRTYTDPSLGTRIISSIALFPVRNAPIAESESIRMNREIVQTVQRKNPGLKIIEPVEVVETLNKMHLVDDYDRYLLELTQTGIPNKDILRRIGEALGVDAIMQGRLVDLLQRDGSGWSGVPGITAFSLRYSIVSTREGILLWETSEEVRKQRSSNFTSAPSLRQVLPEAVGRVITTIPSFSVGPREVTQEPETGPGER